MLCGKDRLRIMDTSVKANVIMHVGTNDIIHNRSEDLVTSYKLIQKIKASGGK